MKDFDYLGEGTVYLDAACQSLRPRPVVEALNRYYFEHNSCGERVKYPWGEKTDELVEETRAKVLKLLKLKAKDYFVSFTLNTTYGINLILNEIRPELIKKVVTSDIEHNSPFLATMAVAERLGVPRVVLTRNEDGSLPLDEDFSGAIVLVNCVASFDGRQLRNIKEVVKKVHKDGGMIIIDAAQAVAHHAEILEKTEADAVCFSAHKMYSASLGVIVARRDLVPKLQMNFIGGGMVDDVFENRYLLSAKNKDHIYTVFEPGLQAWGEIIALGEAVDWLTARTKADKARLESCSKELDEFLRSREKVRMVGFPENGPNPTMSFYVEGLDSHLLGGALGKEGIMARAGYFCVHYYLDKVRKLPPLLRFSLSYATRESDVERVKEVMRKI